MVVALCRSCFGVLGFFSFPLVVFLFLTPRGIQSHSPLSALDSDSWLGTL